MNHRLVKEVIHVTDWVFEGSVEVMRIVLDAEEARIERERQEQQHQYEE